MTYPTSPATTSYRRALDRVTGRYTVAWDDPAGGRQVVAHTRFTDLEGNRPSLHSALRLAAAVRTWWEVKRSPILDHPVPFIVFDAIRHLERILTPGMRVLELGGGNSTLWFLERGVHVATVESSPEWAGLIQARAQQTGAADRLDLRVLRGADAEAFVSAIDDASLDLVLVDSESAANWRPTFMALARPKIRPGGWAVLDNSDHPNNWGGRAVMPGAGRRFTGYVPMGLTVSQTTVWQLG